MLKINHVVKNYGDFHLDCTMEIQTGSVTGLIGKNGAGKTTVFKSILGLIRCDGGSVELFGKDISSLTQLDKQRLGIALSDSGFSTYLSIQDIAPILKHMYSKYDNENFLAQCTKHGLPLKKQLKEYSTGMKAKLKLLIALSHQADFLLLDEPTVGLDIIARDELLELLRDYMEDEQRSILISSHISSDLESLCDDIYMMHEGKIILHEETDLLLGNYALLKLNPQQFDALDKQYLLKYQEEPYGYSCLTNQKQFYLENYPDIAIEKGTIDSLITMMTGGKK